MKMQVSDMHNMVKEKDAEIERIARAQQEKPKETMSISDKYSKFLKKAENALQSTQFDEKEESYKNKIKSNEEEISSLRNECEQLKKENEQIRNDKEQLSKNNIESDVKYSTMEKQYHNICSKYKSEKVVLLLDCMGEQELVNG